MKKLALLCLGVMLSVPCMANASDVAMKTWVDASSGLTMSYPDLFQQSEVKDDTSGRSLELRSADGTLVLDIILDKLEEGATVESELASCLTDETVMPGSARYGNDWFKATLLQNTTLNSIFVRLYDGHMAGFTFSRPANDTTITRDMLYRMQKSLHIGDKNALSDLLPGNMNAIMQRDTRFTLNEDGDGFCRVGSTEVLGEAHAVEDFNFHKWRWFQVTEEIPDTDSIADQGLWLMRLNDKTPVFLPIPEYCGVSRVSLNSDNTLLLVNTDALGYRTFIFDFRTLRKVGEFNSGSTAAWLDSERYIYTEDAAVGYFLPSQVSGVGSVVIADMHGNRTLVRGATQLDNYELVEVSPEEQKLVIRHTHAATTEDWGTCENITEENLILPYPD